MSYKIQCILGTVNHLSTGCGEEECTALYNREIKPLISTLYKFPRISMVLHYSGLLLSWIERRHPELFMLLTDLLSRKQAEILGGGFYEPMISLLPQMDRIGQIEMLTTYLRRQFGKRPQGCWIPCLAWEQNMVSALYACGMGYTFLDETQFAGAGAPVGAGSLYRPCITEDQGKLITIFPIAGRLSGAVGEKPLEVFEDLLSLPRDRDCLLTVFPRNISGTGGDGGEDLAYHRFFEELSNLDSRVEFTTPGRIFKNLKMEEKFYFPGTWGMDDSGEVPAHRSRQFLVDHPEANGVYARMIYTRMLINQLRGDKSRKRTATEELWKAQDSRIFCPAQGICPPQVRKAAYRALLEAERITRERRSFTPSLSVFDIDLDGTGEYLFQTNTSTGT
jgi:hypothetical protein